MADINADTIDPVVSRAWTLPSRFYTDPAIFEAAKEAVFARSWQWIGDGTMAKVPGQCTPFTLLEGCLDEPLLLTRDRDDQLHCLSNVCTHRGNIVVEGATNANSLRCRYHGRRFGLDGTLQSMPEFEAVEGFPCAADNLPRVPFGAWRNLLFASLDPQRSLEEFLRQMDERVGWMPIHEFVHAPERGRDYLVRGHWALYVDNYLEGFHIPYIHAALNATLDYGNYDTILLDHGNLQLGVAADGQEAFDLPAGHPDSAHRVGAFYFWLYPNLMFNFYPWGLSVNVVKPLAPDLTKVTFIPYVWQEAKLARGAGAELDRVEREDEAVVELVQKGLRSRFYDRGRYAPRREVGVHQFHRMLAASLGGP
ncbi:MAG: aromatic ring-hydroxylating dioxygenase subunit alpha [Fimbriimonadaceae bacterium]|nr:aromatic ring-hydroxylating dioxygenase subunit alpha [Fimbriimonadaceae bacterium]QYK55706.1 MAG: aromatic ring-hydroxylating dioxygenase subunit alpha [Fimbriimonadaceae bacterium]